MVGRGLETRSARSRGAGTWTWGVAGGVAGAWPAIPRRGVVGGASSRGAVVRAWSAGPRRGMVGVSSRGAWPEAWSGGVLDRRRGRGVVDGLHPGASSCRVSTCGAWPVGRLRAQAGWGRGRKGPRREVPVRGVVRAWSAAQGLGASPRGSRPSRSGAWSMGASSLGDVVGDWSAGPGRDGIGGVFVWGRGRRRGRRGVGAGVCAGSRPHAGRPGARPRRRRGRGPREAVIRGVAGEASSREGGVTGSQVRATRAGLGRGGRGCGGSGGARCVGGSEARGRFVERSRAARAFRRFAGLARAGPPAPAPAPGPAESSSRNPGRSRLPSALLRWRVEQGLRLHPRFRTGF